MGGGGGNCTFNADAVRLPYTASFTPARGVHGTNIGGGTKERHDQGKLPTDWWADGFLSNISAWRKERTGYPTQKPAKLLERIIRASSNPGDVVLDPFCGCATTLVAAEKLDRHWIGIDLSSIAVRLVKSRMERELGGLICEVVHRTDIPERTDQGPLPDYRTHKHTLYGKQEGRCEGCHFYFPYPNLTVDHVQPRSQGGTHHLSNLQLLCAACNSIKGTGTMADLRARLERRDGAAPK